MRDAIDARLTAAFRDVPVPEGLAERLLERLAAERPRFLHSRRWLLAGGGLLTAAAAILLAVWLGTHRTEPFSEEFARSEAIQSFRAGFAKPGELLVSTPAPAGHPLSQWVVRLRGTTWHQLGEFLGHRCVVYDLPGPAGSRAALYVVDQDGIDDLRATPELHPFTTADCCASAWQEGGLLYVLVVQGDTSTYDGYLNLPRTPVA